jgi:hypothetical protein
MPQMGHGKILSHPQAASACRRHHNPMSAPPAAYMCRKSARRVSSFSLTLMRYEAKSALLISSRNTTQRPTFSLVAFVRAPALAWIPAFAGMTRARRAGRE